MDDLREEYKRSKELRDKFNQYTYYFIIGIVSFLSLTFLPFIGSEVGLAWNIPTTVVGWIVFIVTKLIVAAINILIFHSFMQQAKINVRDNPNYKKANELLNRVKLNTYVPRSPKAYLSNEYGRKATTIFISTVGATFALSQALLTYDVVTLLTYIFTIVMGLIFGIMQMFKTEIYWTEEYLDYAIKTTKGVEEHGSNN